MPLNVGGNLRIAVFPSSYFWNTSALSRLASVRRPDLLAGLSQETPPVRQVSLTMNGISPLYPERGTEVGSHPERKLRFGTGVFTTSTTKPSTERPHGVQSRNDRISHPAGAGRKARGPARRRGYL